MNRIAEKIKKLRIQKKLSQKQLAKSLGVSESYINELETGKRVVNEKNIIRLSKILGEDLNDVNMYYEDTKEENKESFSSSKTENKKPKPVKSSESTNYDTFTSAFSQVLKEIPFLNYSLNQTGEKRLLPLVSNKIEGLASDKVYFSKIEDNSLSFLRIIKNDISFCLLTKEYTGNGAYLINIEDENRIFQIKELDKEKFILLYSDKDSLNNQIHTKTVQKNNIKILAKIIKIEFKL